MRKGGLSGESGLGAVALRAYAGHVGYRVCCGHWRIAAGKEEGSEFQVREKGAAGLVSKGGHEGLVRLDEACSP